MSGITHTDPGAQLTYAEYTGVSSHAVTADLVIAAWKVTMAADGAESMRSDGTDIIFEVDSADELKLGSAALTPNANAGLSLGTDALEFLDLWIDGTAYLDAVTMHGTITAQNVIPDGVGTRSLGSAAAEWLHIYMSDGGHLFMSDTSHEWMYSDGTNVNIGAGNADRFVFTPAAIIGAAADTYDLGSATVEWLNLYIGTGRIWFFTDQGENIYSDGTDLIFGVAGADELKLGSTALTPNANAGLSLGTDALEWNDIWIDGTAYLDAVTMHGSISLGGNNLLDFGYVSRTGTESTTGAIRLVNADLIAWRNAGNTADIGFSVNAADDFEFGADIDIQTNKLLMAADIAESVRSDGTDIIFEVGGVDELKLGSAALTPNANNGLNLGTDDLEFGDIWIDGTAYLDAVTMHGQLTSQSVIPDGASTRNLGSAAAEFANLYIGTGRVYFAADQGENIYSNGTFLYFEVAATARFFMGIDAFSPNAANSYDLGSASNEYRSIFMGTGAFYMYTDQAEYMYSSGSTIVWGVNGVDEMAIWAEALYPSTNKGLGLGASTNRWAASFIVSVTNGTSRTVKSQKLCEVHTTVYCIRGTGGTIYAGFNVDYQVVWCPVCGRMFVEKLDRLPAELKYGVIPQPEETVLRKIKYRQHGAYGLALELHFTYTYNGEEEYNATVLGPQELEDFEEMDEDERRTFIARLAKLEWTSHIRQKRMKRVTEDLNQGLTSLCGIVL